METRYEISGWEKIKHALPEYAIVTLAAFVYVFLFSYSTSPFYRLNEVLKDSYIFQIVGKYWDGRSIPYLDLFDHKGPLIFGIDALGYKLTGNRYGIFAIQVVLMSVVIRTTFKIFQTTFQTFQEGEVKWILAQEGTQGIIQDILDEKYEIRKRESAENKAFLLYRIRKYERNQIP